MAIDYIAEVGKLTLMDDVFMTAVFSEAPVEMTEFILKIILKRKLKVTSVKVQDTITNLHGHGVRLDIHAVSTSGKHFDIEIQTDNKGAIPRRARYNSSILDSNILPNGKDYKNLPETYVVFITKNDVLKLGEPIYFIERMIVGKSKFFDDGAHIVYVNNSIQDDTPLGRLMHDFSCANPDEIFYNEIADRVKLQKTDGEKVAKLAGVVERLIKKETRRVRRETAEQVRRETILESALNTAKSLIAESGLSLEKIASICKLPLEKVQALAATK